MHLGLMSSPVTNTVPPDSKVTGDRAEHHILYGQ